MNTQNNNQQAMTIHLSQSDIDTIYRKQQRIYWEADFVNRCIERHQEEIGLCNIPLDTVADNVPLLDMAYEIFNEKEDSNVAYNDTLDAVVDEVEKRIAQNGLPVPANTKSSRIVIIIDDGTVNEVRSTDPEVQIEITELDSAYVDSEQCDKVYAALDADTTLQPCAYSLDVPGYEGDMELEVIN